MTLSPPPCAPVARRPLCHVLGVVRPAAERAPPVLQAQVPLERREAARAGALRVRAVEQHRRRRLQTEKGPRQIAQPARRSPRADAAASERAQSVFGAAGFSSAHDVRGPAARAGGLGGLGADGGGPDARGDHGGAASPAARHPLEQARCAHRAAASRAPRFPASLGATAASRRVCRRRHRAPCVLVGSYRTSRRVGHFQRMHTGPAVRSTGASTTRRVNRLGSARARTCACLQGCSGFGQQQINSARYRTRPRRQPPFCGAAHGILVVVPRISFQHVAQQPSAARAGGCLLPTKWGSPCAREAMVNVAKLAPEPWSRKINGGGPASAEGEPPPNLDPSPRCGPRWRGRDRTF